MKKPIILLYALLMILVSYAGPSQEKIQPAAAFKTAVKTVAIFKDGYGFYIREGKAKLEDGWCMTDYIPNAALGTFWVYVPDEEGVVEMVTSTSKNMLEFQDLDSLRKALKTKVGLRLGVDYEGGRAEGTLTHILEDLILLTQDAKISAVKLDKIKAVQILDYPLKIKIKTNTKKDEFNIGIGYLQKGIRWLATYILDLLDEHTAELNLRATILNEAEELKHATVYFVVGTPYFSLKDQLDPITVNRLAERVAAEKFDMAKVAVAQVAAPAAGEIQPTLPTPPPSLPTEALTELFLYQKDDISLKPGDIPMVTVFKARINYDSLYEWDVDANQVWRSLVIHNTTNMPLTTGPVMTVRNKKPIGQYQLNYTPIGSKTNLRLAITTDIRTKHKEEEISRQLQELVINDIYQTFALIHMKGTLEIENYKKEAINLEVTKHLTGKVLSASDAAEITHTVGAGLNPSSTIKWKVKVEPAQTKTLEYEYETFIKVQ